jgi:tRNA U34 5-methylaminomethyl-2-thiouridine-forming methyltransferase MnmC
METPQTQFHIQPTADGSDTLYSTEYQQTFHSKHGALTETEHVFLDGTGVKQRVAAREPTRILEVGFGTGLNFWATVRHSRAASTSLHYVALEKHLLPAVTLAQLNHSQLFEDIEDIRRAFLTWRSDLPDPISDSTLRWEFDDRLQLEIVVGDATGVEIPQRDYHAIYHDPFSPAANPELWTQEFFARLHNVLTLGGRLATYSVKGTVRRRLQAVGFEVQKLPGPPGKREMLAATRQ